MNIFCQLSLGIYWIMYLRRRKLGFLSRNMVQRTGRRIMDAFQCQLSEYEKLSHNLLEQQLSILYTESSVKYGINLTSSVGVYFSKILITFSLNSFEFECIICQKYYISIFFISVTQHVICGMSYQSRSRCFVFELKNVAIQLLD